MKRIPYGFLEGLIRGSRRADGSRYTKPSLAARRAANRKRSKVAKASRKRNRRVRK